MFFFIEHFDKKLYICGIVHLLTRTFRNENYPKNKQNNNSYYYEREKIHYM